MKKFSVVIAIFIVLLSSHSFAASQKIVNSKIIQNDNRIKESFTSHGGMEGWASVSFIVDLNGKPKDIIVYDYSGRDRYIKSTIRYVKNLTFSPALINGTPSLSEKNMFLPHTFAGAGYSEASVTHAFAKEYQQAIDMLARNNTDMPHVRILINDLKDDHTKNLNEHTMAAWLESIYYYKIKNFYDYMRQSNITLELHKYTPLKVLSKSSINLFEAQLHFGYYLEALQTLNKISKIKGLNMSEKLTSQFHEQVNNKMESDSPIQVSGKLTDLGGWLYHNTMQKFKVTVLDGTIDYVETRCLGFHKKYIKDWQKTITIPVDATQCRTLIMGEKGTTFNIVQVAK